MAVLKFKGKLLEKKQLTDDVYYFSFSAPEDFSFKAGQFVNIALFQDGMKKFRSYSLFNPPSEKAKIDLCVKILPEGILPQLFSRCFLDIKEGDEFDFMGPFGHFVFDEDSSCSSFYFLGAGTGVAPLRSMILEYIYQCPNKNFTLLFGVRWKKNLFYHEEFLRLSHEYTNFHYIPCLSQEEWEGKKGHVQTHLPSDLSNAQFYICGLKEMVLSTQDILLEKGVAKECVLFERYN